LLAASVTAVACATFAAGAPPIVRVYVAGPPEAVSGARDAIQDLCSRSNVAVVVRDAAGADEALLAKSRAPDLAEAYVDLRAGSPPRVVVVDGETRKDLERRSLPDAASLEISIETVAQVVCAAVESSLATRVMPPPPPATATPEKKLHAGAEPALVLGPEWNSRLGLFGTVANFGAGARAGLGAALGVTGSREAVRFGALFDVIGYPAADVEGAGGLASFGLVGARLLPTLEWHATGAVMVFVGLGGGADWIRISAERPPPGAVGQGSGSSVDAIAAGMLGLQLQLASGVAALLALDADADLSRHRYVIESPQGSQSFFEPARVRPVALAGLSVALNGSNASKPRNEAGE
jgi:hypothetical protein